MVSRLSLRARRSRRHFVLPTMQEMEPRRLLSSFNLYGTSGDDHIVVSFDPLTGKATVSGASNIADGTVFPASTHTDRLSFTIDAGPGNDYVEIGLEPPGQYGFNDATRATILGGAGDDELIGGDGPVTLDGGAGNDKLSSRGHQDEGANALWFRGATSGIHVNLADGKVYDDGQGGIDEVGGIGSVEGTRFDDRIYAGGLTGWFYGNEGSDLLSSATTNDRLSGMSGGPGNDTLIGGDGGMQFYPGSGNDRVIGGTGGGVLRYDSSDRPAHGAVVRLDRGVVEDDGTGGRDTLENIDNVSVDSNYLSTLYGNDHPNNLYGNGLIVGGRGDDYLVADQGTILGGQGDDMLASNGKVERIDGGPGTDLIRLYGNTCVKTKIANDAADTVEDHRTPPTEDNPCPTKEKEKKHDRPGMKKKHVKHHPAQKKGSGWEGRRWVV